MSYDLMVFDPEVAPKESSAFKAWFHKQAKWSEGHSYSDPAVSTPGLRVWFFEMIKSFPAMNGPFSKDGNEDNLSVTDYCVGRSVIYTGFRWEKADEAYETMFALAGKHGVGFYNVSSENSEVWLPNGNGGLLLAFYGNQSSGVQRQIRRYTNLERWNKYKSITLNLVFELK